MNLFLISTDSLKFRSLELTSGFLTSFIRFLSVPDKLVEDRYAFVTFY